MFTAAFTSALPAYPQAVHTNRAWLSRESASTCPHAEYRWQNQVPAAAERQPRQYVHLGVRQGRAEYLPGGPSASVTRLRAERTISPSGVAAQAPTAMFPLRSASHAWRNASCHGLSRPAQSRAAGARGPSAGGRSTTAVSQSDLTATPVIAVSRAANAGPVVIQG